MTPAKKVAVKAKRRYSLGFVLGSISARSRVPKRSETTATGPIAISFELPIHAYTNGGTKLESIQEFEKQAPKVSISMSHYEAKLRASNENEMDINLHRPYLGSRLASFAYPIS